MSSTNALGAIYEMAPSAEEVEWQLHGLCNGYDPELFQPSSEVAARTPKRICLTCPVLMQCRQWAVDRFEIAGVWGGLSERDRREIWKGRGHAMGHRWGSMKNTPRHAPEGVLS